MAKVTIVIEDDPNRKGIVKITPKPSFAELMKKINSGDELNTSEVVAASALMYMRKKGKTDSGLKYDPKLILPS